MELLNGIRSSDRRPLLAVIADDDISIIIEDLKIEHIKSMAGDYVTVSMGLICKNAKDINSMDEIYKEADENLYKAKERGRNNIVSNFE